MRGHATTSECGSWRPPRPPLARGLLSGEASAEIRTGGTPFDPTCEALLTQPSKAQEGSVIQVHAEGLHAPGCCAGAWWSPGPRSGVGDRPSGGARKPGFPDDERQARRGGPVRRWPPPWASGPEGRLRRRDQEGVPQARASVPPDLAGRRVGRGAVQGGAARVRRPRRRKQYDTFGTANGRPGAEAVRRARRLRGLRPRRPRRPFRRPLRRSRGVSGAGRPARNLGADMETEVRLSFDDSLKGIESASRSSSKRLPRPAAGAARGRGRRRRSARSATAAASVGEPGPVRALAAVAAAAAETAPSSRSPARRAAARAASAEAAADRERSRPAWAAAHPPQGPR